MAGIFGEDDPNPPPPNQGVLDYIAGQQAAFQPNYPGETWQGTVNEYTRAAMQPGMSGYFDLGYGGNITPHQFSVQDVAQQAGLNSPGQLGQGFFPSGGYGDIGYNIPNDRGGFFNPGISGLPTSGSGLSTNNWRFLGRGPGWIMRNGELIDTTSPYGKFGWTTSGVGGSGPPFAEAGSYYRPFVGPFNALLGRNIWDAKWWPGATQWTTGPQQAYTS